MNTSPNIRATALSVVEWTIGLSPAGPLGRNPGAGGPREGYARSPVGTRAYWGSLPGPITRLVSGRLPTVGEAVVGTGAQTELGLADGAGTVDDELRGPIGVVGTVGMEAAIENLDRYLLIRGGPSEGPIGEVIVLVRRSDEVEPFVALLPAVLGTERPDAIGIDRATQLLRLRAALVQEVGDLDGAVLIGSLASSTLLVGAMLYGAIAERRREFGIRRSQGASRNTIAVLVVGETFLLAAAGAAFGAIAGTVIVARQTDLLPDPVLSLAISVLVILAALLGSLPAASTAAFDEPLYVLRST